MARSAYESAEYKVVESDGKFEVREYPDLMLLATTTKLEAQGRDGSFMKLFRYISGVNVTKQKISMIQREVAASKPLATIHPSLPVR